MPEMIPCNYDCCYEHKSIRLFHNLCRPLGINRDLESDRCSRNSSRWICGIQRKLWFSLPITFYFDVFRGVGRRESIPRGHEPLNVRVAHWC